MFKVEIATDNAAFYEGESPLEEVNRIIQHALSGDCLQRLLDEGRITLLDINGNSVGHMEYVV